MDSALRLSLPSWGVIEKTEDIEHNKDIIEMMKNIKEVLFKFDRNKELTDAMCGSYMAVLRYMQQEFETNQEFFGRFKNFTSNITQYDGSIGQ